MKWNQFLGGVLVGAAFGIMVGVAVAPGSGPDNVSTSTAGFCSLLAIAGVAAAGIGRRRSRPVNDTTTARPGSSVDEEHGIFRKNREP